MRSATFLSSLSSAYFGYTLENWAGMLTAALVVGLLLFSIRKTTADDGRPPGLVREYRLILGVAIPLLGFGLLAVLWPGHNLEGGIPVGITIIAMGLSTFAVQVWQIRRVEQTK